jgi:2-keto-4-pentenoate hydratase/2-oxohepta-3-ene-1,7-dioic acid hydratase in catechol pathway
MADCQQDATRHAEGDVWTHTKLVCAQLSFREGVPDAVVSPTFFLKSPDSVIGPDDVVELSAVDAAVFHHEAELAVVIGSRLVQEIEQSAPDQLIGNVKALVGSIRKAIDE